MVINNGVLTRWVNPFCFALLCSSHTQIKKKLFFVFVFYCWVHIWHDCVPMSEQYLCPTHVSHGCFAKNGMSMHHSFQLLLHLQPRSWIVSPLKCTGFYSGLYRPFPSVLAITAGKFELDWFTLHLIFFFSLSATAAAVSSSLSPASTAAAASFIF